MTVSLGTARSSFPLTVTPAAAPAAAGVNIFPRVAASCDDVTIIAALQASAPPGGVTVTLASDSAALAVPATAFVPGGAGSVTVTRTAGAVAAPTIVHISETLGATTLAGQVEIDPARVLTDLALAAPRRRRARHHRGVSASIPAVGNTFAVTLSSSNPAVAAVPPCRPRSSSSAGSPASASTSRPPRSPR